MSGIGYKNKQSTMLRNTNVMLDRVIGRYTDQYVINVTKHHRNYFSIHEYTCVTITENLNE